MPTESDISGISPHQRPPRPCVGLPAQEVEVRRGGRRLGERHGVVGAQLESLKKLEREEVKLAFVHRAVGGITQQDVQLAATSGATIIEYYGGAAGRPLQHLRVRPRGPRDEGR